MREPNAELEAMVEIFAKELSEARDAARARTTELHEAHNQQRATADVLKVISHSTFDLQTVLDELVGSIAPLWDADKAGIVRQMAGDYREVATCGQSPEFREYLRDFVFEPGRGTATGRVLLEGRTVHILDALADPEFAIIREEPRRVSHCAWRPTLAGRDTSRRLCFVAHDGPVFH